MSVLIHTAIRIHPDDLAEIDRRAKELGITRTSFLIDGSLNRLPEHRQQAEARLTQLEETVDRLDRYASLTT